MSPRGASSSGKDPSGGAAPALDLGKDAGRAQLLSTLEVVLAVRGDVSLDTVGDASVLTHLRTHEVVRLPAGSWELVGSADEGGECSDCQVCIAGIEDDGSERILDPEDLFTKVLLRHPKSGDEWVMQKGTPNTLVSFDMEKVKHRLADCSLQLGSSSAAFDIEVAVFRRCRTGNLQAYWSLNSIYKGLGLTAFKFPSNWVQRSLPRWLRACEQAFGVSAGAVVLSCSHADAADKKNSVPWPERCLPFPGVATWALLLLAFRWHSLPREVGGVSSDKDKRACELFAVALRSLISLDGMAAWDFEVLLIRRWTPSWPRPSASVPGPRVRLIVSGGRISLGPLLSAGEGCERVGVAHTWLNALFATEAQRVDTMQLAVFINKLIKCDSLRSLLAQFVFAAAKQIERMMGARVTNKEVSVGLVMRWRDSGCDLAANEVDKYMAQYITNCRMLLRDATVMSIATDKGSVNGLPLQDTIIGVPTGYAVLAPPAVLLVLAARSLLFQPRKLILLVYLGGGSAGW